MCGICGHLITARGASVDRELLERMNSLIVHRGPDSEGYYLDVQIGLAMRRLSVIDLDTGDQPIFNEDKTVVVVYNGEIYNFPTLKDELLSLGHTFRTKTDTEVIVHAYEQWGDDALQRFNGMFAIALWDASRERLLLARDCMGQKPLYWHYSNQGLLWGSSLACISAAPWVGKDVDPLALHHYLTLQYVPDPQSILKDVFRLPPAHKLVIENKRPPVVSRWWKLEFLPKTRQDQGEIFDEGRRILSSAVKRCLISDVPLGIFLSGGIDSSLITALANEHAKKPLETFSIVFKETSFSESYYSRLIAEEFQTKHHEFLFQPEDLTTLVEDVVTSFGEPIADPAALPLYALARETRKHVTVALSGDGGDETMAGYQRYALDKLLRPYALLPDWITQQTLPRLLSFLPEASWIPEDQNPILGLKRLSQFASTSEKASLVRWGSYFSHKDKLTLYQDELRNQLAKIYTEDGLASVFDEAEAGSLLDRTLYVDHQTYLAGDLLPKTDRMTMAHSLEARAPFLDNEWVEWTAKLPEKYKIRGLGTKWLLKRAFTDMLPKSVYSRRKKGFSIPVGHWIKNELHSWTEELLLQNDILTQWFSRKRINDLLREHDSGRINHGKRLWALIVLSVWSKHYQQSRQF